MRTFAVIALAIALAACGGSSGGGGSSQGGLRDWTANYMPGQGRTSPLTIRGNTVEFTYPTSRDRQINSLAKPGKPKTSITVRFTIYAETGTGFEHDDPAGGPARVVLFAQQCGDDYRDANGRYWHAPFWTLPRPSEIDAVDVTARLDDGMWTNVNGKKAMPRDICNVGLTFGGGNSHGHGNWATGAVRMVITMEIN